MSRIVFFKEVDSFSHVICYPDGVKGFHCCLSSKSKDLGKLENCC